MRDAPCETSALIHIEVIYADTQTQIVRLADVPPTTTVHQAIAASGILDALPEGFVPVKLGIFGRIVAPVDSLRDGDRIELYRPLTLDPKEARRRRASRKKNR